MNLMSRLAAALVAAVGCAACGASGSCSTAKKPAGSCPGLTFQHVDATTAEIGLRQDTHTYVVFVRVGVDPLSLTR